MRLIDADALIADLENDVAIDQDTLDYEDLTEINRANIQFDKDCKQNAIDLLKDAPTIEPERRWIPCSERLPEEWGDYLVTKKEIGWNCEEYQVNDIAYYDRDGFHKANTVFAWMPLPEPWR